MTGQWCYFSASSETCKVSSLAGSGTGLEFVARLQSLYIGVAINVLIAMLALYAYGQWDRFGEMQRRPYLVLFLIPLPLSLVLVSLHFLRAGRTWSNVRIRVIFLNLLLFLLCPAMAAGVLVP